MITGCTTIYGILGHPVAHSLSPAMQNAAFDACGLNAIYVPFHVLPEQLETAVKSLDSLGVRGVNVTVPHKEAIIPHLDEVDPRAAKIGAVNTVVVNDGRLVGHNTDWVGFLHSVQEDLGMVPQGAEVVVLGAGGASRAGIVGLAEEGAARITIVNRTLSKAEKIVSELNDVYPHTSFNAAPLSMDGLSAVLTSATLIVNSISAGLQSDENLPIPWQKVSTSACFFDMLYSPAETKLVQQAKGLGLKACDGMGMLAGQGEEAFRLWTGQPSPKGLMRSVLESCRSSVDD